jgi:transposase
MPHLHKKTFNGRTYWYLRETERVGKKVRVKWQKYLGTPQTMMERLERNAANNEPLHISAESFGAVFVAHMLETRLDTIGIINAIVPREAREVGPSIGEYFFYAWANRLIAPKSKRALEEWYRKTAIEQLRPVDLSALSSQRYWEKWERVSANAVEKIGEAFFKKVWATQNLPPECVLFDTTNYFTYMASDTVSELAQRGHNKAGKHQLRQIGVGLLVDRRSQLPLYYRSYEGNTHDSKLFHQVIDEMFGVLCGFNQTKQRLTVVFDKGMNAGENIEFIDDNARVHFITSYSPYFAEELGATELKHFAPLAISGNYRRKAEGKEADCIVAYRTKAEFWGKERTVVVTHNPATARKKGYTLERKLETVREALLEARKNYREALPQWRSVDAVKQRYERLCERLHIGSQYYCLEFGDRRRDPELSVRKDDYQVQKTKALHGRNVIVTDNHDWSTEEIVQMSLDRYVVEKQFRTSKSPQHVRVNPIFHWTDSKIRCQLLTCVIALTVLRLFEIELERAGVATTLGDHSAGTIIEELRALNSVVILRKGSTKPELRIEDPTPLQKKALAAIGYKIEGGSVLQIG